MGANLSFVGLKVKSLFISLIALSESSKVLLFSYSFYTTVVNNGLRQPITAAWLAQLVERQSAVREVEGSSPRPDQHSGS